MNRVTLWHLLVIAVCSTTGFSIHAFEVPNQTESVQAVSRQQSLAISQRIDELVAARLSESDQELNPLSADDVFLRRVYLDIVGRIPTLEETKSFLADSSQQKREELIDNLLDSYGYVSRQYNFWADLLRIQSRLSGNLTGYAYIDFVKDSLEQNLPYDEFVTQLLTAEGGNVEPGKGAVGYYLRDRNMPEDNMSNTIRLFLGTRLECAQCHDHPFDKWSQRQYFEMVAFTGGLQYRVPEIQKKFKSLQSQRNSFSDQQQKMLRRLSQVVTYGISGSGTGLARLPEGYLGEEGYEGEIVPAKTMFESKQLLGPMITDNLKRKNRGKSKPKAQQVIRGAKPIGSRDVYAKWLTSSDNPRFATVIANRLWKQAFGLGLIEPVDILEDSTVASNPPLMDYLTETMVELDFDMKQYLRAIYNTRAYQAEAFDSDVNDPQEFCFNGPIVRRMSAEQIWDSLLSLTVPDTDVRYQTSEKKYLLIADSPYEAYEKISQMSTERIRELIEDLADGQGKGNRKGNKMEMEDSAQYQLKAKRREIGKKIQAAKKGKNVERVRELMIEQAQLVVDMRKHGRAAAYFQRASELPSPTRPGHFLREFGQSDREQIDNSNTDPAVTQVLSMMNGYVEEAIARDTNSVLMQAVVAARSAKECTETIFLSMLNRLPSSQEMRAWEPDFRKAAKYNNQSKIKEIYSDLIWTLANSNEFIFVK